MAVAAHRRRWPVLVSVAGLAVAAGVAWMTFGQIVAVGAPGRALAAGRSSSTALANEALALATRPGGAGAAKAGTMARQALRQEPSNPRAALAVAVTMDAQERQPAADALLRYSESLSRRELLTQLGLIENAVAAGNVPGALRHYDRALTTSKQAHALLTPVLVDAAAEPGVAGPLATMLAQRPLWWRGFMEQLGRSGRSAAQMRRIATAVRLDVNSTMERALLNGLLGRMVEIKGYGDAARLHAVATHTPLLALTTGSRPFDNPRAVFPFDWRIVADADIGAYMEDRPHGPAVLVLRANDGASGTVARRLVLLPPGNYAVTVRYGGVGDNSLTRQTVSLRCAGDQNPFRTFALPGAPATGQVARFAAAVGQGCPAQWLEIGASGSDGRTGVGWIEDVRLDRSS